MNDFIDCLNNLYGGYGKYYFKSGVPDVIIYTCLAFIAITLACLIIKRKAFKDIIRGTSVAALVVLLAILYCSTVIYRKDGVETGINLMPFWSYFAIMDGKEQMVLEKLLNVLVYIPIGFLCGIVFKEKKLKYTIIIGAVSSAMIEISQYAFGKGFAELDDVIHNTLGCLIGFGVYLLLTNLYRFLLKSKLVNK